MVFVQSCTAALYALDEGQWRHLIPLYDLTPDLERGGRYRRTRSGPFTCTLVVHAEDGLWGAMGHLALQRTLSVPSASNAELEGAPYKRRNEGR